MFDSNREAGMVLSGSGVIGDDDTGGGVIGDDAAGGVAPGGEAEIIGETDSGLSM